MYERPRLPGLPFPVFRNLIDYGRAFTLRLPHVSRPKMTDRSVLICIVLGFVKQQGHKVLVGVDLSHL
jgi:hypothetical protein